MPAGSEGGGGGTAGLPFASIRARRAGSVRPAGPLWIDDSSIFANYLIFCIAPSPDCRWDLISGSRPSQSADTATTVNWCYPGYQNEPGLYVATNSWVRYPMPEALRSLATYSAYWRGRSVTRGGNQKIVCVPYRESTAWNSPYGAWTLGWSSAGTALAHEVTTGTNSQSAAISWNAQTHPGDQSIGFTRNSNQGLRGYSGGTFQVSSGLAHSVTYMDATPLSLVLSNRHYMTGATGESCTTVFNLFAIWSAHFGHEQFRELSNAPWQLFRSPRKLVMSGILPSVHVRAAAARGSMVGYHPGVGLGR